MNDEPIEWVNNYSHNDKEHFKYCSYNVIYFDLNNVSWIIYMVIHRFKPSNLLQTIIIRPDLNLNELVKFQKLNLPSGLISKGYLELNRFKDNPTEYISVDNSQIPIEFQILIDQCKILSKDS